MADQAMQQPQYGAPQYGAPQGAPGTTVIVVQQGPVRNAEAEQILTSGLCGCFDDCETCLCATFCAPCAYGTNMERAGLSSCCGACFVYACLCTACRPCLACYAANMRTALFMKVGLPDPGCCINWCCHCCCACCTIAQEGRAAKKIWMANGGDKPAGMAAQR